MHRYRNVGSIVSAILDWIPFFGPLLLRFYGRLVRGYVKIYTIYQNWKYDAYIDPYRLYWVDPSIVAYEVNEQFWFQAVSTVRSGDWDREISHFDNHILNKSFKQHFERGIVWENTPIYQQVANGVDLKHTSEYDTYKYKNKSDTIERLKKIDRLYKDLTECYKTQSELRNQSGPAIDIHREHLPPELLEVAVDIGRNGELLFDDGRHRLALASIAGIDEIPVRVLVRHTEWQAIREEVAEAESPENLSEKAQAFLSHPDIVYLHDGWTNSFN